MQYRQTRINSIRFISRDVLIGFLGPSADYEAYGDGRRVEAAPHNHAVRRQAYVMEQFDAGARHEYEGVFGRDCLTA